MARLPSIPTSLRRGRLRRGRNRRRTKAVRSFGRTRQHPRPAARPPAQRLCCPLSGSDPRGACAEARPVPAPAGIRRADPIAPVRQRTLPHWAYGRTPAIPWPLWANKLKFDFSAAAKFDSILISTKTAEYQIGLGPDLKWYDAGCNELHSDPSSV